MSKRKRRLEEELEEEERGREPAQAAVEEKERPKEREATAAERVLDLQKTAGNRATVAAISRTEIGVAAPQWPKESEVIVDGVVMPMSSFSWPGSNAMGTGSGVGGEGQATGINEVNVVTPAGEHSPELYQKAARGDPIKTVIIVVVGKNGKGFTVTLTDVLISSFSTDGRTDSWSMNFAKREFSTSPPPAQP